MHSHNHPRQGETARIRLDLTDANVVPELPQSTLSALPYPPGRFQGFRSAEESYRHRSPWHTYSNVRVDLAAASTYLLGPVSGSSAACSHGFLLTFP